MYHFIGYNYLYMSRIAVLRRKVLTGQSLADQLKGHMIFEFEFESDIA